jgi:hypothetical protein
MACFLKGLSPTPRSIPSLSFRRPADMRLD